MRSTIARPGGFSFPTTGGRILLAPGDDLGGGVPVAEPSPLADNGSMAAPPTRDPVAQPPTPAAGERNFSGDSAAPSGSTLDPAGSATTTAPVTPADPNQAAGASDYTSIRDAARLHNFQFSAEHQDDESAFAEIIRRANANTEADYYAQLGRRMAPHAEKFKGYLTTQQQTDAAPSGRKPWEAPEYDERWLAGVTQDPATGLIMAKPGFPPEIAEKVSAYVDWKREYEKNPSAMINQMVKAEAEALFDAKFAERSEQQERRSAVQSIKAENSSWFNAKDGQGRDIIGQNGHPVPSQLGAAYLGHLKAALAMGITDSRHQDRYAKTVLQGELAQSRLSKLDQGAQAAAPASQFAAGNPSRNPLAALTPTQQQITPGATDPSTDGLSLNEVMRRKFAAEGVTDADFNFVG